MLDIDRNFSPLVEQSWRDHAPELLRYATVLVGPGDAHDIVADAFLRSAPKLNSATHPRAYLFQAVTRHAHDLRRGRERRWARDLAALGPNATLPAESYVDVRRAIARLSLMQRCVVYFAYWEDLTEREIATMLGLSVGTVHRHLERARTQLRKALR